MGDDTPNPLASIPFDLTETDKQNLLAGDAAFHPHTWSDLSQIIGSDPTTTKPASSPPP